MPANRSPAMRQTSIRISRRSFAIGAAGLAAWPHRTLAQTPRRGGTLVVAADTEPRNLNPGMIASNGVFYVASKVIEPLAEMGNGPDGLVPRLATAWSGSPDGRSAIFKLREGVQWHDGKPFTAADVAFSAMNIWKPLQNIGRSLLRDLEAVETPDATTAVFRFARPMPFQLLRNALPAISSVLPRHIYETGEIAANPANAKLVGTGPFRFVEHKPGEYFRLARNEKYWEDGRPYLDGIVYQVLPDRAAIAAALEANRIQLAAFSAVPLADLDRIGKVPGIKVYREGYDGITYQLTVEINHRRKELADARVRRAIAHAIDRTFVVNTIFLGVARPALGPVPQFDRTFLAPGLAPPEFSVQKANALLDEAGFPRGANGMRFSVRLLPAPWFDQTRQFGDYLRQALRAIGIEASIVNNDPAAHLKAVYTDHAFDLAVGSPVYRNDPAISTAILYQGGLPAGVPFANQYGYNSAEMNALLGSALSEADATARAQKYHAFQKLAEADMPLIMVAEFTFTTVARTSVMNVSNNPRWATSHWADCWLSS